MTFSRINKIEKLITELCPKGVEFKELRKLWQGKMNLERRLIKLWQILKVNNFLKIYDQC